MSYPQNRFYKAVTLTHAVTFPIRDYVDNKIYTNYITRIKLLIDDSITDDYYDQNRLKN